ncbi:exodeoxyribonuclease VII large subunit [Dehalococcoidia bacterium]|nr:exodeoxyribonuclease VII large subunit [Dehalococcoidia bacterium]
MALYSVSQITKYIKDVFDLDDELSDLWVKGEVSNVSHSAAGHFYFTLKDATSQIRCVMFRPAYGSEHLMNGVSVSVHGRVSIYEVRGDMQLYGNLAQPEGVGERYLELELLKSSLEQEGLFLDSRKRRLPKFPKKIGVATSPNGSVWHDIQNVIARRFPLIELVLAPTSVQGGTAPQGIVQGLRLLNDREDIDLIIVARGGGSAEELWAFNEEIVCRAIYGSKIPVISAVGHETDVTLSDLVADYRAPTPSAAAEIAVPDIQEISDKLYYDFVDIGNITMQNIDSKKRRVSELGRNLRSRVPNFDSLLQRLDELTQQSGKALLHKNDIKKEVLNSVKSRLQALNPENVLSRGYSILQRSIDSTIVSSKNQVQRNEDLVVTLKDGKLEVKSK